MPPPPPSNRQGFWESAVFCGGAAVLLLVLYHVRFFTEAMRVGRYSPELEFFAIVGRSRPDSVHSTLLADFTSPASLYLSAAFLVRDYFGIDAANAAIMFVIGAANIGAFIFLARRLSGSLPIGVLVATIMIVPELVGLGHFGANGYPGMMPIKYWLMMPCALVAVTLLLDRRLVPCMAMLTAGFLFQPPQALLIWLTLIPIAWWIFGRSYSAAAVLTAGLALVLLVYASFFLGSVSLAGLDPDLWVATIRLFNSGHVFFDSGVGYWAPVQCFAVVLAGTIAAAMASEGRERDLVLGILIVGSLGMAAGQVFVEVLPLAPMYLVLPIRLSTFIATVALAFMLSQMARAMLDGRSPAERLLGVLALAAAATGAYPGLALLAVCCAGRAILVTVGYRRVLSIAAAIAAVVVSAFALPGMTALDLLQGARWRTFVFALAAGLLVVTIRARPQSGKVLGAAAGGCATLALVMAMLAPLRFAYLPTFVERMGHFQEASDWLRANTLPTTPILTSALWGEPWLEVTAGRESVLQLQKSAWVYLHPSAVSRIAPVLSDLGVNVRALENRTKMVEAAAQAWRAMTPERLRAVGIKYGATHLLAEAEMLFDLPVRFRNQHYVVYALVK